MAKRYHPYIHVPRLGVKRVKKKRLGVKHAQYSYTKAFHGTLEKLTHKCRHCNAILWYQNKYEIQIMQLQYHVSKYVSNLRKKWFATMLHSPNLAVA
jgi:hypothetical protein